MKFLIISPKLIKRLVLFLIMSTVLISANASSGKTAAMLDSVGTELFKQAKFSDAAEKFRQSLKADSTHYNALWGLAASYVLMNDVKKARELIHGKFVSCNDKELKIELQFELSGLMYIDGMNEQANKLLLDLVEHVENISDVADQFLLLQTAGMIWREAGDMTHAEMANRKRLDFAVNSNVPDSVRLLHHTNALWDLSHFAIIRGEMTKAREYETALLNLNIEKPEENLPYQKMQAMFALYGGRYDEAIEFFKTRNTDIGKKRLAFAYEQKGDKELANKVRSELAENYSSDILYLMIRNNILKGFNQIL